MKPSLLAGLLASLFLLSAAPADAAPKKRKARHSDTVTPASVMIPSPSADPAPKAKKARPAAPKASQFIASGVPLTEVREGRLKSVATPKRPCGRTSAWAKIGSAWTALDAWGQVIQSRATISDRRYFEGSGCHEVSFSAPADLGDAARLFVAKGSGYAPRASAEWKVDKDHAKRFEQLYAMQESVWVEGHAADKPATETAAPSADKAPDDHPRTLFFQFPKQDGSVEGAPTQRRPTQWAVSGGRVLVVGYVGASGAWKVGLVMPPNGNDHAYEPSAVFDMNGDGLPEIVVHEEAGGVFVDRVLSFDPGTMRWEKSVESPGGATR